MFGFQVLKKRKREIILQRKKEKYMRGGMYIDNDTT